MMGIPVLTISSEGQPLESPQRVLQVEVRRDVNRVPEADLTLVDGSVAQRKFALSDATFFEPGKLISIAVRDSAGNSEDTTIFEGLVVRHAIESRPGDTSLRVELKDRSFKLTRTRTSKVHRDQTDDAIIRDLLDAAEVDAGEIEATDIQHKELVQFQSSDWDFIVSRADALGLVVDVDGGRVSVRPMVSSAAAKARLQHGMESVDLALEIDASDQWAGITSRSWDVQNVELSAETEAEAPSVTVGNLDPDAIAPKLGGDSCALVHPAILEDGELAAWASSRLTRSRLSLLRGTATTGGRTDLVPLDVVELVGVGDRFNGDAIITGVTHRIDRNGWRTELRFGLPSEAFARRSDIADVLAGGLLPPVQGLHVGVVGDYEEDELGEHRIKVQLSTVDSEQGAVFARVARPDAGAARGFAFWPEPGDEVIVGFINGDPRQAIVLGSLYGSVNAPPEAVGAPSEDNHHRAIVSRAGIVIAFDDENKSVRVETPGKNQIVLDDKAKSVTLTDQHGNTITLDENGITLKSVKDFNIDASKGNVVIKGKAVDVQ
jgi:Rhs element Vgr protein